VTYPSPAFGDSVWFLYYTPGPARLRWEIFNASGEKVAAWETEQTGAGYHRTRWDIGGVAPGVYLYTLRVESSRGVKIHPVRKLVVVKP